ncbi:MAG: cytochrome c [Desulfovibrionaceae bacterium]|jgi:mono/diheme cytochrome c family protein|nr:cytochrome c [Desulfovibrionaceae bacterium]
MNARTSALLLALFLASAASRQVAAAGNETTVASMGPGPASSQVAAAGDAPLYKVTDGYKVDPETFKGFQTWRAAACERCHGPNQEGLVGPSLVNSLKVLSKDDFVKTVRDGRSGTAMAGFAHVESVMNNVDHLYAYLKGRSDGAITRARVERAQ